MGAGPWHRPGGWRGEAGQEGGQGGERKAERRDQGSANGADAGKKKKKQNKENGPFTFHGGQRNMKCYKKTNKNESEPGKVKQSQNKNHIKLENEKLWPKPGLPRSADPAPRRPPGPSSAAGGGGQQQLPDERTATPAGSVEPGCGWHRGPLGPKPHSAERLRSPRTGPRTESHAEVGHTGRRQRPPAQGDAAPGGCSAAMTVLGPQTGAGAGAAACPAEGLQGCGPPATSPWTHCSGRSSWASRCI